MTTEERLNGDAKPAPPVDRDELRREIAATRSDLADTLAALVAKGDVKARVGGELHQLRERAVQTAHRKRTLLVTLAGTLLAAVAVGVVVMAGRRGGRR